MLAIDIRPHVLYGGIAHPVLALFARSRQYGRQCTHIAEGLNICWASHKPVVHLSLRHMHGPHQAKALICSRCRFCNGISIT